MKRFIAWLAGIFWLVVTEPAYRLALWLSKHKRFVWLQWRLLDLVLYGTKMAVLCALESVE